MCSTICDDPFRQFSQLQGKIVNLVEIGVVVCMELYHLDHYGYAYL